MGTGFVQRKLPYCSAAAICQWLCAMALLFNPEAQHSRLCLQPRLSGLRIVGTYENCHAHGPFGSCMNMTTCLDLQVTASRITGESCALQRPNTSNSLIYRMLRAPLLLSNIATSSCRCDTYWSQPYWQAACLTCTHPRSAVEEVTTAPQVLCHATLLSQSVQHQRL
jgi:hypothetical protein